MQQIFMVGAKLLGIYFIVDGLIEGSLLANPGSAAPFANQLALSCLLHLTAGTVLAFFTGIVANVLRVPQSPAESPPSLTYRSALQVGIVLIGLWQLIAILPRAVLRAGEYLQEIPRMRSPLELVSTETVGLAATLLLIVFAHRIAALLERVSRQSPGP